jgi:hypothetical protein
MNVGMINAATCRSLPFRRPVLENSNMTVKTFNYPGYICLKACQFGS